MERPESSVSSVASSLSPHSVLNGTTMYPSNIADVDRQFGNIRRMLHLQNEEVRSDIEQAVLEIRQQLLDQLDKVFHVKLSQLKVVEDETKRSGKDGIDRDVFYRSTALRSLTSLDWLSNPLWKPTTLGYLKACEARPEHLILVDDYSSISYKIGDNVQVYYKSTIDYDPFLFNFISSIVYDPYGATVHLCSKDFKNGLYVIEFSVTLEGCYSVYIRLYNIPIRGNPFFIHVTGERLMTSPLRAACCPLRTTTVTAAVPSVSRGTPPTIDKEVIANTCKSGVIHNNMLDASVRASSQDTVGCGDRVKMERQRSVIQDKVVKMEKTTLKQSCVEDAVSSLHELLQPTTLDCASEEEFLASRDDTPTLSSSCSPSFEDLRMKSNVQTKAELGSSQRVQLTSSPLKDRSMSEALYSSGAAFMAADSLLRNEGVSLSSYHGSSAEHKLGTSTQDVLPGHVSAQLALEIKSFQRSDPLRFPIGVSTSRDGNIIVADTGKNRVLVFDSQGTGLHSAALPRPHGFRRPSAVVCMDNGCFAVKDDCCVYVFSKHGEFIRSLGKTKLCRPYGLAVSSEGMLFTLALGHPAKIWRFHISGVMESSAIYMPLFPRPRPMSKCRFLDIHKENLFVADLGLSSIYKSDLNGNVVCSFGKSGRSEGEFSEPSGVCAVENCLFIGDSKNNRVQVFDFNGKFKSVVKFSSGIHRPSGIHASADNKLYVLNYLHGVLKVFKLESGEGKG